jgi:NDP-sugar pyrophosphorylase family protein
VLPKALLPIGRRPLIEIMVRQLASCGIGEVILALDHLAELVVAYVEATPSLKQLVPLRCVKDETPGGTAGPLANITPLDDTFLVVNGDVVTRLDYGRFAAYHREHGAALTIAVHRKEQRIDFGVVDVDETGLVGGYAEKPTLPLDLSMGIYACEPRVLGYIRRGERLDFPDLVARVLAGGEKVVAYRSSEPWLDIGQIDEYARAQAEFGDDGK